MKITTMLSKILTIAFVCIAFLDAGAMGAMSDFLKVKKVIRDLGDGRARFSTISRGHIDRLCRLVADSAYDQTFKKIFADGNEIGGIAGKARLTSFLNSLFYPNAGDDDFRIKDLEYLPSEVSRLGIPSQLGILRFDIACRCKCWGGNPEEEEIKVFDVEMQTAHERSFIDRLLTYGSALKVSNPNNHVIVLAFLNYKGNKHPHSQGRTRQFFVDEYGNPVEPIKNFHDDYCIDLSHEITALMNNTDIIIDGEILGIAGREWLKLLSLRQWATCWENKYVIPTYEDVTPAVASALNILSTINQMQLAQYINDESFTTGVMQTARDEGMQQGMQQGEYQARIDTARRMLLKNVDVSDIAEFTGLRAEEIQQLRSSLRPA